MTFSYRTANGNATLTVTPEGDQWVAVASKGESSMVMSNPRSYNDTVEWCKNYCGLNRRPLDYDVLDCYLSERLGY
jgi:hypothetical protein